MNRIGPGTKHRICMSLPLCLTPVLGDVKFVGMLEMFHVLSKELGQEVKVEIKTQTLAIK